MINNIILSLAVVILSISSYHNFTKNTKKLQCYQSVSKNLSNKLSQPYKVIKTELNDFYENDEQNPSVNEFKAYKSYLILQCLEK